MSGLRPPPFKCVVMATAQWAACLGEYILKKIIAVLSILFTVSISIFAEETFKCRKETYIYENHTEEFYFINNFMFCHAQILDTEYNHLYYKLFYKDEKIACYHGFGSADYGKYLPDYISNGVFFISGLPEAKDKIIEEVRVGKADFYRILADEFYKWYLQEELFNDSDFYCLADFIRKIKIFSKEDLRILRNTIYARYGYKFRSKDLNELFSKTDWYSPKVNPENFDEDCYFSPLDESLLGVINLAEK